MRSVLLVSMKKDEISIKINEGANYERIIEKIVNGYMIMRT